MDVPAMQPGSGLLAATEFARKVCGLAPTDQRAWPSRIRRLQVGPGTTLRFIPRPMPAHFARVLSNGAFKVGPQLLNMRKGSRVAAALRAAGVDQRHGNKADDEAERQQRSYAERMDQRFKAWEAQRLANREEWVRTALARDARDAMQRNSMLANLQQAVRDTAWDAHCALKHQAGSGGGGSNVPRYADYTITVFTMDARHDITIPLYTCEDCEGGLYTVWPSAMLHGFWPSSPALPSYWIDVRLLEQRGEFAFREGVGCNGKRHKVKPHVFLLQAHLTSMHRTAPHHTQCTLTSIMNVRSGSWRWTLWCLAPVPSPKASAWTRSCSFLLGMRGPAPQRRAQTWWGWRSLHPRRQLTIHLPCVPSAVTWEAREVRRRVRAVASSLEYTGVALIVNCSLIAQSWPRNSSLSLLVTERPSPAAMKAVGPVRRSGMVFSTSTLATPIVLPKTLWRRLVVTAWT
jgi:hypothetical protein